MGATLGFGFGIPLEVIFPFHLLSFAVILPLAATLLLGGKRWGFTQTEQLVLGRQGRGLAVAMFVGVYMGYGVFLRPEFFSLGVPLLPILLIYAGLIALAAMALRRPRGLEAQSATATPSRTASLRYLLLYLLSFLALLLALLAVHLAVPGAFGVAVMGMVFAGTALPMGLLALVAWRTLRSRKQRSLRVPEPCSRAASHRRSMYRASS